MKLIPDRDSSPYFSFLLLLLSWANSGDYRGGDFWRPNDEEDVADILSRVRIVDAPILLFVCFHKATRSKLDLLCRLAETASLEDESRRCRELVAQLQRRFQFLKLAHKYHYAAEDEVSFSYNLCFVWLLSKSEENINEISVSEKLTCIVRLTVCLDSSEVWLNSVM